MSTRESPRSHLLLPWAVQEREDPVLEFDHAEGMYFSDRQGRRYLDFVSQVFHCTLGHGNRRVIEAVVRQAERACVVFLCLSASRATVPWTTNVAWARLLGKLQPGRRFAR